jgi:RNA polymerase sigma-70 factor (ECF subfamily)
VRLKFQGGLSYREIAEVMGTNANNVGVMLHTAIATIRRKMAETPTAATTRESS